MTISPWKSQKTNIWLSLFLSIRVLWHDLEKLCSLIHKKSEHQPETFDDQKCTNDNCELCTQLTSSRNRFKSCCLPESGYSFRLEVNIHLWGSFVLKWPPCLKCSHSLIVLTAEWTKRPKGCFKTSVLLMLCYWHSWQHIVFGLYGPITIKVQRLFVKMCWRR